jgi:hypothetical protein
MSRSGNLTPALTFVECQFFGSLNNWVDFAEKCGTTIGRLTSFSNNRQFGSFKEIWQKNTDVRWRKPVQQSAQTGRFIIDRLPNPSRALLSAAQRGNLSEFANESGVSCVALVCRFETKE